jgi:hypothetical protein
MLKKRKERGKRGKIGLQIPSLRIAYSNLNVKVPASRPSSLEMYFLETLHTFEMEFLLSFFLN